MTRLTRRDYHLFRLTAARVNGTMTAVLAAANRRAGKDGKPVRPEWILGSLARSTRRRGGATVVTHDGPEVVPDGMLRELWEICSTRRRHGFCFDKRER